MFGRYFFCLTALSTSTVEAIQPQQNWLKNLNNCECSHQMQYIQTEQKDTKNEMEGKEFQGEA